MKSKTSGEIMQALAQADHAPGWNNRPRAILRFDVAGNFGRGCALYVVPYRRWAYRRQELVTAAHRRKSGNPQGSTA